MKKEIARFRKNSTEEVIIKLTEINGQDFLDLRVYVNPVIPSEELIATKKGICLRSDLIPAIQKALKKAEEELKKQKQEEKK